MPKRISRTKRVLQGIVRRYQARDKNHPKMPEPAAKQEQNVDELIAFSEAHYAQSMLSKMARK